MEKKLKTYVLMISRVFPAKHPRAGQQTYFREKIQRNCIGKKSIDGSFEPFKINIIDFTDPKLHTIRENYDLWASRADKINRGEAVLSLRQWTGKPYNSKQVEFIRLEKIGVQRVKISRLAIDGRHIVVHTSIDGKLIDIDKVSKNDGLSVDDFCKWHKKDIEGVCIHFTDFKY